MADSHDRLAQLEAQVIASDFLARNASELALEGYSNLAALRCIVQALVITHPNRDALLAAFIHETDVVRAQKPDMPLQKLRDIEDAWKQIGEWFAAT